MSTQTRTNWLIDAIAFLGACLAALSGISFLFLPSGDELRGLNTFGSGLMIVACAVHLARHWPWVKTMAGRCVRALLSRGDRLSTSVRLTVIVDTLLVVCFLVTIASGFLVSDRNEASGASAEEPFGGLQRERPGGFLGARPEGLAGSRAVDQVTGPLFQWAASDLIHLGAVVGLCLLTSIHLGMHWRWIINVTGRLFTSLGQRAGPSSQPVEVKSK